MSQTKRAYDKFLLYALLIIGLGVVGFISATTVIDPSYISTTGPISGSTGTFTGALTGTTLDTGQGANELFDMDQNVLQASAVTFATVNTGHGVNELYSMNQDVESTDAVVFSTVNTGQGANELFDMDQNVETDDAVEFLSVTAGEITAANIILPCSFMIDKYGANARLINGSTMEILATTTSVNAFNWAIGNLTTTGGKIIFSGDHNIGANELVIDGSAFSGWLGADLTIEGLGRGVSILRRTGDGILINITGGNIKIRDMSLRTTNGTVIHGHPSFTVIEYNEITCGNWYDVGWCIDFEASEQCELNSNFMQSYGDGIVRFTNNAITYDFGNTEITGQNMWWMYTPGAHGLHLEGTALHQVENIHVSGKLAILATTAATVGHNYVGIYMKYAYNNQITNTKVERCAISYHLVNSRYNVIDIMYRASTYMNTATIFKLESGSLNNHIMRYKTYYRGTSNVTLINDASSTLNNPNVYEGFALGFIETNGNWINSITDYAAILWMGGEMGTENLYGQNGAINAVFPTADTAYSFEHHCSRVPATVLINWNEVVVEDWWITSNSTHITISLADGAEQDYTFDWSCSINKQGIG